MQGVLTIPNYVVLLEMKWTGMTDAKLSKEYSRNSILRLIVGKVLEFIPCTHFGGISCRISLALLDWV